jgi:hypothetical protein
MPRIFDNIDQPLLPALRQTLQLAERADFCVGYFNLRGWKQIDACIDRWSGGEGHCCRLLVGMQRLLQDDLREAFSLASTQNGIDNQAAPAQEEVAHVGFQGRGFEDVGLVRSLSYWSHKTLEPNMSQT